ncbi:MAG: hypothetical protein JWM28_3731 [Chitinophagaceae bacterium]|nr:hypothetical protein [Chitinophagaceae bacterium]
MLITDPVTGKWLEIARLIAAFINGTISLQEYTKLEDWLEEGELNKQVFRHLTDPEVLNRLLQEKYN